MKAIDDIIGILTLIIVVAIIAVLISPKAKTTEVIASITSGLSNLLSTVVSPVTGGK